jgi:hypothetical protein
VPPDNFERAGDEELDEGQGIQVVVGSDRTRQCEGSQENCECCDPEPTARVTRGQLRGLADSAYEIKTDDEERSYEGNPK